MLDFHVRQADNRPGKEWLQRLPIALAGVTAHVIIEIDNLLVSR